MRMLNTSLNLESDPMKFINVEIIPYSQNLNQVPAVRASYRYAVHTIITNATTGIPTTTIIYLI